MVNGTEYQLKINERESSVGVYFAAELRNFIVDIHATNIFTSERNLRDNLQNWIIAVDASHRSNSKFFDDLEEWDGVIEYDSVE